MEIPLRHTRYIYIIVRCNFILSIEMEYQACQMLNNKIGHNTSNMGDGVPWLKSRKHHKNWFYIHVCHPYIIWHNILIVLSEVIFTMRTEQALILSYHEIQPPNLSSCSIPPFLSPALILKVVPALRQHEQQLIPLSVFLCYLAAKSIPKSKIEITTWTELFFFLLTK